ncbi:MAG TPA: cytochrome c peroxidase [Nannocystaceae bacterium]|nr:cytochrome c peroxidase [Nannocystaceae bacterium]
MRSLLFAAAVSSSGCVVEEWGLFGDLQLQQLAEQLGGFPGPHTEDPTNAHAGDAAAALLGQHLFFDASYSATGRVSCATCHDPASGFQDARANTSLGLSYTPRHAPSCLFGGATVDASGTGWQFWDGRRDSLWSQALGPPENDVEMGGTRTAVAYMIHDRYRAQYEPIFGALPRLRDDDGAALFPATAKPGTAEWELIPPADRDAITAVYVGFGKAIDAYERQLASGNSAFDRFYVEAMAGAAESSSALTPAQKRGLGLFIGKANCVACHDGPFLSDGAFHNTGVAQQGEHLPEVDRGRADGITQVRAGEFNCATKWSDHPDKSRCAVATLASRDEDIGAFKTPSLRDVALTAPYMHTGELADLDAVVRFYNDGGAPAGFSGELDDEMLPLALSELEIADLVAFLESLTGDPLPAALTMPPA